MAPTRSSSCPSQATLLRDRGDLCGKRACFQVQLTEPTPLALQADRPLSRIGLDLRHAPAAQRLVVAEVDKNPRRKTPASRYNLSEERRSNRDKDEKHASFALLPGDRLRSVNDVCGGEAMLAEIEDAVKITTPKKVNLAISRNLADVLTPIQRNELQSAVSELPSLAPEKPATAPPAQRDRLSMTPLKKRGSGETQLSTTPELFSFIPEKPPTAPPAQRGSSSMTPLTKKRGQRMQLTQAGRVALAS